MLRFIDVLVVGFCLMLGANNEQSDARAKSELLSLERRLLDASNVRDVSVLNRLMANDFVHITYSGRVQSKKDALEGPVAPPGVHQVLSEEMVRIYGTAGIVTGLNTVTRNGRVEIRLRFTDVFIRTRGSWRSVSAQETPEQ